MTTNRIPADFFAAFNDRDLDRMGALLAEDATFAFPKAQPLEGRERILRFFKVLLRRFPRLAFALQGTIEEGARAAVHWTNQGETKTGDAYANEGVTLFEVQDGRIRSMSDFFKNTEAF